jgi:Nucleotidyl transferase AbiEii toxin, Type IV TA system
VAPLLEEHGFPCAVVGGLSLHAFGRSRATFDLDLVTVAEAQGPLVAHLESLGYETLHRSAGYSNHSHADAELGSVDVVYVDPETARRLFPTCTRRLRLGDREVPVPRAEHLIAMKIQALRNDPSRELQDLADIQYLLGLPDTNREEARGYFSRAGMSDWYDKLIERL